MAALDSKIMDIKLFNRKKCIGEYEDIYHVFYPNYCEKYNETIKENPDVFKTYKGVFTNMYDAANRNGNIIEVFKKKHLKKEENKKDKNSTSIILSNNNFIQRGSPYKLNKNNSDNMSNIMNHESLLNKLKNSQRRRKLVE